MPYGCDAFDEERWQGTLSQGRGGHCYNPDVHHRAEALTGGGICPNLHSWEGQKLVDSVAEDLSRLCDLLVVS